MANELRFVDGDLLFDGGNLAMSADCCCGSESLTCAQWNDATTRAGIDIGYDIGGVTFSASGGCGCSTIPVSGIATIGGCAPAIPSTIWCRRYSLGCSNSCVFFQANIGCSGGIVTVNCSLSMSDCTNPTLGGDFNWIIIFRRSFAEAAFLADTSYDIPRIGSPIGSSSLCQPIGHATATLTLSYTI